MSIDGTLGASISQRIDSDYAGLTHQERRVADFILDHLDDLAIYSATELAQHSGVSKATVSRLFRRLGFADAQEVREHVRTLRRQGVPLGSAATGEGATFAAHLKQEAANSARLVASLTGGRFRSTIGLIAEAGEVVVLGHRNSYPVALHLRQQLAQVRGGIRLAPQPGQSIAEELTGLGVRDAVVVVGFRRRAAGFATLMKTLGDSGVPTVLIADSSARRHGEQATIWIECPVDSVGPLDSYGAAMNLVNLLANGVLGLRIRPARHRIAGISSLYDTLAELE